MTRARLSLGIEVLFRWLARLLIAVSVISLALMMVHVCVDVFMKYALNSPIPGTAEVVAYYYMVAAVFLPLPLVELGNKAIAVDLFWNFFPGLLQRLTVFIGYAAQVVFFVILAMQTGDDALSAFRKNELVEGIVPLLVWPGRFFLPAAFWLASAVSVLRLFQVALSREWRDRIAPAAGEVA